MHKPVSPQLDSRAPIDLHGQAASLAAFVALKAEQKRTIELDGYFNGDPETNGEYALIRLLNGRFSHFLDVGFNEGQVSAFVGQLNPDVGIVGFEPNPKLPTLPTNYPIKRIALSDENADTADFYVHSTNSGVSSLSVRTGLNPSFRDGFQHEKVQTVTLDTIAQDLFPDPQVDSAFMMKIDVEGSEAKVLRGASDFLSRNKVFGYFEYSFGWQEAAETFHRAFQHLEALGYACYRVTPVGLEHIRFFHPRMEHYMYCNIFFCRNGFLDGFLASMEVAWEYGRPARFYAF
jgi:FkbM family methyltransferase